MRSGENRDFSDFEITVAEVWSQTRQGYSQRLLSFEEAQNAYDACKHLLINEKSVSFTIEDFEDEYNKKELIRFTSCKNLEDYLKLDFFFDRKYNCYSFSTTLTFQYNSETYPLLFVIKLLTYANQQLLIEEYFGYQFVQVFKRDATSFQRFLKVCIRQHENFLKKSGMLEIVNEWMTSKGYKRFEPATGLWKSFMFKNCVNPEDFFREHSVIIYAAFDQLKSKNDVRYSFIDHSTSVKPLRDLFSNKVMDDNKVNWVGTLHELKEFINLLIIKEKINDPGSSQKWTLATKCFLHYNNRITKDQLRKANSRHLRYDRLSTIVSTLP